MMRTGKRDHSRRVSCATIVSSLVVLGLQIGCAKAQSADRNWTQFGGPRRDFVCHLAGGLATAWPSGGPEKLWSREIGDGYSSIIVEGDTLYTMCRRGDGPLGDKDAVLAIDAKTGKTLWETTYESPVKKEQNTAFGPGPHATPLLVGDRLFTTGAMLKVNCLDKKTGKILWSHDLYEEMEASVLMFGYGASPASYKDLVIITVPVRGDPRVDVDPNARPTEPRSVVVSFRQETGERVWTSEKFLRVGHATPVQARFGGIDQFVLLLGAELVGINPVDGRTIWKHRLDDKAAFAISTPLVQEDGTIFVSGAYGAGTWAVRVEKKGEAFETTDLWFNKYLKVHHGSFVRFGDYLYGSSGDFGPAFIMCVDIRTGDTLWRDRSFAKANCLLADGRLVILDENGDLALADVDPSGIRILCRATLLTNQAWTVPTIIGSTMYLRDRKTIMAVDLSKGPTAPVG